MEFNIKFPSRGKVWNFISTGKKIGNFTKCMLKIKSYAKINKKLIHK